MRKLVFATLLTMFACSLFAQIVHDDGIVYVRYDGTGNGSSWVNATSDLQGAIDAEGVIEVRVTEGVYYPTWQWDLADSRAYSFRMKNEVKIVGSYPYEGGNYEDGGMSCCQTILSGDIGILGDNSDNSYHVIYCAADLDLDETAQAHRVVAADGNANLESDSKHRGGGIFISSVNPYFFDCEARNNFAIRGGGVYIRESNAELSNCYIHSNNSSEIGGGILMSDWSSPALSDSRIYNNESLDGAGIAIVDYSNPIITESVIFFNIASQYGGGVLIYNTSNAEIISCNVYNNTAGTGGGILVQSSNPIIINSFVRNNIAIVQGGGLVNDNASSARYINCTIFENTAPVADGVANNNSNPCLTNCIIYGHNTQIINLGSSIPAVNYCCVENNWLSGTGNFDSDPGIVNVYWPDVFIDPSSQIIDGGINDSVPEWLLTDFNGKQRIQNTTVDVGAVEFQGVIYVDVNAVTGSNNGSNWFDAFTSLEDALQVAQENTSIWVADGIYYPSNAHGLGAGDRFNTFMLKNNVRLLGGFNGTELSEDDRDFTINKSILEGNLGAERVYHVVYADGSVDASSELDGFVIRNGQAGGASYDFRCGANVYVNAGSPIIKNCEIYGGSCGNYGANVYLSYSGAKFEDCYIGEGLADIIGGGIAIISSNSTFTNCNISENYAYGSGGALYVTGTGLNIFNSCRFLENNCSDSGNAGAVLLETDSEESVFVNCLFASNASDTRAGAMEVNGRALIVNSNFESNYVNDAGSQGGNIYCGSEAELELINNVIINGVAENGPQIYNETGAIVSISNCIIQDCGSSGASWNADFGIDGGQNIEFDYYWSDIESAIDNDWPGIDAGTNEPYYSGEILEDYLVFDGIGNPRLRRENVDIGYKEIPYCYLQVNTTPSEVNDIAYWRFQGASGWNITSEDNWETAQSVTIEFSDVESYFTPESIDLVMEWGHDYIITGEYILNTSNSAPDVAGGFTVFPNPCSGLISISNTEKNVGTYLLYSSDGRILESRIAGEDVSFDLSSQSAGVYFIKCDNRIVKIVKL